jgi:hypothetical protein
MQLCHKLNAHYTDDLSVINRACVDLRKHRCPDTANCLMDQWNRLTARNKELEAVVENYREEIEVLRDWGNKDCTAMADDELQSRRTAAKENPND